MVTNFTNLSRDNIVDLLEASGYNESSSDIIETEYVSSFSGTVKYKMKYYDIDDNLLEDNVYVFIRNGKLVADF